MTFALEGKVAIVTGAGGRLGNAVSRRFASAGAQLLLADTNTNGLNQTIADIDAPPETVIPFPHSIDDKLGVQNLIHAANGAFGRIDTLVTTDRTTAFGGLFDVTRAELTAAFDANVSRSFLQTQLVAKWMVEERKRNRDFTGSIVHVSFIAGQRTAADRLPLSVSCAALEQLTRSLASTLAPSGIRVNAVALGSVATDDVHNAIREHSDLRDALISATPLGRVADAGEAADAVLFLACPSASFITGQVLAVDGGRLILDPLSKTVR